MGHLPQEANGLTNLSGCQLPISTRRKVIKGQYEWYNEEEWALIKYHKAFGVTPEKDLRWRFDGAKMVSR